MRCKALLLGCCAVGTAAVAQAPVLLPAPKGKEGVDWAQKRYALRHGMGNLVVVATAKRPVIVPIPTVTLFVNGKKVAAKQGNTDTVSVTYLLKGPGKFDVLALCGGPTNQLKVQTTCTITTKLAN